MQQFYRDIFFFVCVLYVTLHHDHFRNSTFFGNHQCGIGCDPKTHEANLAKPKHVWVAFPEKQSLVLLHQAF